MIRSDIILEIIQFEAGGHWPDEVHPWSKENYQPRDCSWGWVDCDGDRVHILDGDYIVRFMDTCLVIDCDNIEKFKDFMRYKFNNLMKNFLHGSQLVKR